MLARNWKELIKPSKVQSEATENPSQKGTFIVEPLERGFGLTLGNALRRVLLSSLQGAAITSVSVDGVEHEFSSINGVREDVTDIILNLKSVIVKSHTPEKRRLSLSASGPKEVTAAMIETGADIEILNKDQVICTLDQGATINMEMTAENGKGYVPVNQKASTDAPIGYMPIDALYLSLIHI